MSFLLATDSNVKGLSFSPEADRETLLRRIYFDLVGLPPSLEAIDAFLADESPEAWSKVVDELLNSTAYGERWARHWLDVAGYADSDGYTARRYGTEVGLEVSRLCDPLAECRQAVESVSGRTARGR